MGEHKSTTSDYALAGQKAAAALRKGDAKPLVPSPRVRRAIDQMVFEGLKRDDAAEVVGLKDHALREALKKPHVLAYLSEQQEVLRTGARPRALRQIIKLSDSAESEKVKLEASKYLDGMDRNGNTVGAQTINVQVNSNVTVEKAGYVIDLSRFPPRQQISHLAQHEPNPLADKAGVPEGE